MRVMFGRALAVIAALAIAAPAQASRIESRMPPDVAATLQRHHQPLRRCVDRGLRDTAVSRGKLVVKFRVERRGRVRGVEFVRGPRTLRNARVERCVRTVLRSIRFPRQASATWFTSPLVFTAT